MKAEQLLREGRESSLEEELFELMKITLRLEAELETVVKKRN